MIDKRGDDPLGAVSSVRDGETVTVSGLGDSGRPNALMKALIARRVFVMMDRTDKSGAPRVLARVPERCTHPLAGAGCVRRVFTSLAALDATPEGFLVRERAPGLAPAARPDRTAARLRFAEAPLSPPPEPAAA